MRHLIITAISFLMLTSCMENKINEVTIITKVDAFQDPAENEDLGKDLIFYNYSEKIKKQFPGIDLKDVSLQYFRQSGNNEVTVRLMLTNTAMLYSKDLTAFLTPLVKQNMSDYVAHINTMRSAVACSEKYSRLIQDKKMDSLWNMTSTDLKGIMSKGDLEKGFHQKDSSFHFTKRVLTSKQYFHALPLGQKQLNGDFYLLNYTYGNAFEQIALQGDSLKLVGYTFYKTTN